MDSRLFKSPLMWKLWTWLLIAARWEDGEVNGVPLKRGQLLFGKTYASRELDMPERTIWDNMNRLKKWEYIRLESTHQGTIVTIINYDIEQHLTHALRTASRTPHAQDTHLRKHYSIKTKNIVTTKDVVTSPKGLPLSRRPLSEIVETLKTNEAYKHIDFDRELGKMQAWLAGKPGRKLTYTFILNWLNKIVPPLEVAEPVPPMPIASTEQPLLAMPEGETVEDRTEQAEPKPKPKPGHPKFSDGTSMKGMTGSEIMQKLGLKVGRA